MSLEEGGRKERRREAGLSGWPSPWRHSEAGWPRVQGSRRLRAASSRSSPWAPGLTARQRLGVRLHGAVDAEVRQRAWGVWGVGWGGGGGLVRASQAQGVTRGGAADSTRGAQLAAARRAAHRAVGVRSPRGLSSCAGLTADDAAGQVEVGLRRARQELGARDAVRDRRRRREPQQPAEAVVLQHVDALRAAAAGAGRGTAAAAQAPSSAAAPLARPLPRSSPPPNRCAAAPAPSTPAPSPCG
jgi:hypothetical protein